MGDSRTAVSPSGWSQHPLKHVFDLAPEAVRLPARPPQLTILNPPLEAAHATIRASVSAGVPTR